MTEEQLSRDCYIVRVYRRDRKDFEKITGIVETVGAQERHSFSTLQELSEIMAGRKKNHSRRKTDHP